MITYIRILNIRKGVDEESSQTRKGEESFRLV